MAITLDTLVGIIKHSDTIDGLIGGGEPSTQLTYGRLVAVANDPLQLKRLTAALDGLRRAVRVLRETKVADL